MIQYFILLFILNGTGENIIDTCNELELFVDEKWMVLNSTEKENLIICRVIHSLELTPKQVNWLNGSEMNWSNFHNKTVDEFIQKLELFQTYGIKNTLDIESDTSMRDSLPPPMWGTIEFYYIDNSEVRVFSQDYKIGKFGLFYENDNLSEKSLQKLSQKNCHDDLYPFQNIRSNTVCVFPESIDPLLERGYLVIK